MIGAIFMVEHWKELLPVDRYVVRSNGLLHDYDRKIMTMLYQPLIGSVGYSLYMTLWGELDIDRLWGEDKTHHQLMSIMQLNLKHIYNERKKLEGIGLLKTFIHRQSESRSFIYELQPPITPKQFFDDGVLNVYLYNRIGKTVYNKLKAFFSTNAIDYEQYEQVTHSFNEVFVSLHQSELESHYNSEMSQSLKLDEGKEFIGNLQPKGISISHIDFDFGLMESGITDTMIPKKSLTNKVKEMIGKLAFIYGLSPLEMKDIVMRAFNPMSEEIDLEELRKIARDFYQFEHGEVLPSLHDRLQPIENRVMTNVEPQSKDEELMKKLEVVSPLQLLKDISGGAEPSVGDMQVIEEVMLKQQLHPGVVNVLIYYVMLKSDMRLSKNYVTKIASHWARKKITTVPEAMRIAKEEHRQYQEWASSKNNKGKGRKPVRQEMLPEWLKKQKLSETKDEVESKERNNKVEETTEREKFEELINRFKDESR